MIHGFIKNNVSQGPEMVSGKRGKNQKTQKSLPSGSKGPTEPRNDNMGPKNLSTRNYKPSFLGSE